jgi:hypothetical protein
MDELSKKLFVMAGLTRHPLKIVKHQYSKFIERFE